MKSKVLLVWGMFVLVITAAHVSMNVGWKSFRQGVAETLGAKRHQLFVGFLPVT
jgi:hypothetical protein